jgi:hypothetical protein
MVFIENWRYSKTSIQFKVDAGAGAQNFSISGSIIWYGRELKFNEVISDNRLTRRLKMNTGEGNFDMKGTATLIIRLD